MDDQPSATSWLCPLADVLLASALCWSIAHSCQSDVPELRLPGEGAGVGALPTPRLRVRLQSGQARPYTVDSRSMDGEMLRTWLYPVARAHGRIDPRTKRSRLCVEVAMPANAPFEELQRLFAIFAHDDLQIVLVRPLIE